MRQLILETAVWFIVAGTASYLLWPDETSEMLRDMRATVQAVARAVTV